MTGPLRLPAVLVTSRHAASVYPWQTCQTLPSDGVPIGINHLAGGAAFSYDPWDCYAAGTITSPNMVVLGQLGVGKSALVKTYLHRQLAAGRQVFILDPKGEYAPLAKAAGLAIVRLVPGGSERLNPLDPPPGPADPARLVASRTRIVAALAGGQLGRELAAEERAAIAAAVDTLTQADAQDELGHPPTHPTQGGGPGCPTVPVLSDVVDLLLEPTAMMATTLRTTPAALAAAARPAALELHRLLAGDLAGLVDGPSTARLDPDGPGIVVDLSAAQGTDALTPVMVCAGGWLAAALDRPSARKRLLLVDEAWALLGAPATTRWLQSVSKLARAHGAQLITVVHRLSDLTGQADAGTATAAQAGGLLADAETRVVYRQAAAEHDTGIRLLGLTSTEAALVGRLPAHRALWLIGRHAAVVDHILADDERCLIDTDARMRP